MLTSAPQPPSLFSSITIGMDGMGLVNYLDFTNYDLKMFHCASASCNVGTAATLDSAAVVGYYTSVTIGVDGLALISYYDASTGDLKVFHCSNVTCSPYTRVGR